MCPGVPVVADRVTVGVDVGRQGEYGNADMSEMRKAAGEIVRVPGIIYAPIERRARVQGTGIEVFEVIKSYRSVGQDWERLRKVYHWLSDEQLRAALTFYAKNRPFVDARLAAEETPTLEEFWAQYPQTRPPQR